MPLTNVAIHFSFNMQMIQRVMRIRCYDKKKSFIFFFLNISEHSQS